MGRPGLALVANYGAEASMVMIMGRDANIVRLAGPKAPHPVTHLRADRSDVFLERCRIVGLESCCNVGW